MKIELPATRAYAALFVVGARLSGSAERTIGAVIVKCGFSLVAGTGGDTHALAPAAAPVPLVLADQGADPADGIDVAREADIAPFKPLADVVVEGFRNGLTISGAELRIDGATWLTRAEDLNGDNVVDAADTADLSAASRADRNRHLFGYQPRTEAPRQGDADADPDDRPKTLAQFDHYANRFLNAHRRGGGFTASAAIAPSLANGQRITVRKAGADSLSLTLALPRLSALYRTWCGHGPDAPPYWTRRPLGPMRADTLILRPDAGTAEVLWRADWPWNAEPPDRYRAIRVTEGGP
jgi:hypothetical protein